MSYDFLGRVLQMTGGKSTRSIATRVGMIHTTLTAHLTADVPNIETVLKIAHSFNLPIIRLFIEAGYITEEQIRHSLKPVSLDYFTDLELQQEMLRRTAIRSAQETTFNQASTQGRFSQEHTHHAGSSMTGRTITETIQPAHTHNENQYDQRASENEEALDYL
jgi:Ni,Fe-hydrogenase I large subunit